VYANPTAQHQTRPSMSSSNSHGHQPPFQSSPQSTPFGNLGGRQQSFERQGTHHAQSSYQYHHAHGSSGSMDQAPYSASATMSSGPPLDWHGNARLPTRSATDPSSPYLADGSPRSHESNGHGTPRADNQSVFAAQQAATPRASIPERPLTADQNSQQQYPSGLRIMPPPPIPPLSPSRQIRAPTRGTRHDAHITSASGGDNEASRRTGNARNPARSPTTTTFLGTHEQHSQAQSTNRPDNVPLPPSESSHQEHHSSEMEKREQSAQGNTAVIESASSDAHLGHRHMLSSTPQSTSTSSSQPSVGVLCGACGTAVKGQYVRAMGKVYHLDCFKCRVRVAVSINAEARKLIFNTF
jgi:hypothetical protein